MAALPNETGDVLIDAKGFSDACGEPLDRVLDIDTWESDPDLAALCQRIESEIGDAVQMETTLGEATRRDVFARLADPSRYGAPAGAGVYQATPEQLLRVCRQVLFNGAVEACDGTRKEFNTLPITITQIGVCLTAYCGSQQSFAHRLYQRDLRVQSGDLLDDLLALLDSRKANSDGAETGPSNLFRRSLMTYAERAVLTYKSNAPWRMGHGKPIANELLMLTGVGSLPLFHRSLNVLRDLILGHRRFVFVPSEDNDRRLLTLGHALRAGQYAIVQTCQQQLEAALEPTSYRTTDRQLVDAFVKEVGSQVVVGVYRAAAGAPPYIFYSHVEHCHEAALIVMADSLLQDHRGFPLLIDLADRLCRAAFGNDIFDGAVESAYARADAPFRFLGERQTRG